jgi:hypothetical protein
MPTEDYSNTRRIARIRQIASLKGLGKVARAIDSETQLVIKQGGIKNVMKTPTGLRSNCGRCTGLTSNGGGHPIPTSYYRPTGDSFTTPIDCFPNNCIDDKNNTYTYVDIIPNSTITTSDFSVIYNGTGGNVTVSDPNSFPIFTWTLPNTAAIVTGAFSGSTLVFS